MREECHGAALGFALRRKVQQPVIRQTNPNANRPNWFDPTSSRMLSDEQTMEDEKIEQGQDVWSAIRYLDPDEAGKDQVSKIATVVILFVFVVIMVVWVTLSLRGL